MRWLTPRLPGVSERFGPVGLGPRGVVSTASYEARAFGVHSALATAVAVGLHRADDGPAYLTILVVGHLLAVLLHVVWTQFRPEPWVMAVGFSVFCVALSLYLLPRLKGVVVNIQWAKRMHGFGSDPV